MPVKPYTSYIECLYIVWSEYGQTKPDVKFGKSSIIEIGRQQSIGNQTAHKLWGHCMYSTLEYITDNFRSSQFWQISREPIAASKVPIQNFR